jgi:hypothetical protein
LHFSQPSFGCAVDSDASMRFPLRFTSNFVLGVTARAMRARGKHPFALKLPPCSESPESSESDTRSLPPLQSIGKIVWIGGAEPLEHPEIPRFATALAASGHEVFLHTDGALLRRRLHEFRPSQRFRFVFSFEGLSIAHSALSVEAIRVAQLAGFLVCALTVVRAPNEIEALAKLFAELHRLELDGYLIVPAVRTPELNRAVSEARHRMLTRRWRQLSGMFDSVVFPSHSSAPVALGIPHASGAAISHRGTEQVPRDCEEGAQA